MTALFILLRIVAFIIGLAIVAGTFISARSLVLGSPAKKCSTCRATLAQGPETGRDARVDTAFGNMTSG